MYAENSEKKLSKSRIALVLLCGLAVCCAVMYVTDETETIHEIITGKGGKPHDAGTSVDTTDVLKAGQIYTETPDGRMRLMDYFNNVEKEISDEVANRKADIASVRAQMARDFAFNSAARSKLKRAMMHKMAVNAKIARDHLAAAMRKTNRQFAKQAHLANRRYKATLRRDHRTRKLVRKNKRQAARNLKLAVSAWQKNTQAWAAATNAKIDRMNKAVSANAAQIVTNAKKARKDLDNTMNKWDHKINTFRTESAAARSKLSAQFAAQSKATRAWASNKIKGLVASTAAQFNDVEIHMAKNRHEVDMQLRHATMRFESTLNAQKALEDKRYAQTVANIAAAKREANEKLAAAKSQFKVSLLSLQSEVKSQVSKVNNRIDHTAGVVRSDAAAQAKVNANVNAEMGRMIALGNKRYKHQLKKDAEMQNLIAKDKAATDRKLNKMAASFNDALSKIRSTLKKNRAHAEKRLNQSTNSVFKQLYKNQAEQAVKNAKMAADTRRMRLDAMDNLRKAKAEFRKKIHALGKVVADNDKKADKKIEHLTGVVKKNEMKAAKGRQLIAQMEAANKNELKHAVAAAIAKGEKRAQLVEERGKKMDKDTKWLLNNKLNSEITKLRDETNASVEALALQGKEARAQMQKEMLYAIRSAAEVAKEDLGIAVETAKKNMAAFQAKAAKTHAKSAMARKALKAEIEANAKQVSRMIRDAVATDASAQTALAQEVSKKIKATNKAVDAHAQQMRKNAKHARDVIATQTKNILKKVADEQARMKAATKGFSAADAKRQAEALGFLKTQIAKADKDANAKFGAAWAHMAKNRAAADVALASATKSLNDNLAKQAALADSRFEKTVKDLGAARKAAIDDVAQARKDFATGLASATAMVRATETKIASEIEKISGEVSAMKALQVRVNVRTMAELKRVEKLSNDRYSEAKRARGKLKMLMDENKAAAAAEVKALAVSVEHKLKKLRAHNAHAKREMAKDLTGATEKYYEKLSAQQKKQMAATNALNAATKAEAAAAASAVANAKKLFDSKIVMLTDTVTAHEKAAAKGLARITGVAADFAKASKADRQNIKTTIRASEADLSKALNRAVSEGEAKGKAVAQRIAEHLKDTKRFLQVELAERVDAAADNVLKIISGKRQKIADNYLSLKAYAVAAADTIQDYTGKGKGRALSAIGDLLTTVGALGAAHAAKEVGVGLGGTEIPAIFSGKSFKVSNAVGEINGLVHEYTSACGQVRNRWPMGLGKYLLDKLQVSMSEKGVLQVDKVSGKPGNFVFINGRSVGLSNKLSSFSQLASRMSTYEAVLAKMTAKIKIPHKPAKFYAKAPEWQGN